MSNPIEFDPDTTDVDGLDGYNTLTSAGGPRVGLTWAIGDARVRAKQLEMIEIDRDMNDQWIAAMEKLFARDLDDATFTTERMFRLKLWQRDRKRRQHNLHYKYDIRRRRPGLVDRDVNKQLAVMRARLEEAMKRRRDRDAAAAAEQAQEAAAQVLASEVAEKPAKVARAVPKPILTSTLDGDEFLARVSGDTGLPDPVAATDDELAAAYRDLSLPPTEIGAILAGVRAIRGFELHYDD
jgi:hypothetical protein